VSSEKVKTLPVCWKKSAVSCIRVTNLNTEIVQSAEFICLVPWQTLHCYNMRKSSQIVAILVLGLRNAPNRGRRRDGARIRRWFAALRVLSLKRSFLTCSWVSGEDRLMKVRTPPLVIICALVFGLIGSATEVQAAKRKGWGHNAAELSDAV